MNYYQSAGFWVGALVILIYALERFNTPPTNRPSTTWLRYYSAAFVYVGLFELTFVLLCHYPGLLDLLRSSPGVDELLPAADASASDSQFGTAILLSVLVPKVPGLHKLDLDVRERLQRAASIPSEARRFAREILRAPYQPDEALTTVVQAGYRERGVEIPSQVPMFEPLHRLVAMMLRLRDWECDPEFAAFLQERSAQYERLQGRYQRVFEMARGYFQLGVPLVGERPDGHLQEVAQRFQAAFEEETQALLQEGAELVSHTLLKCCVRATSRQRQLRLMGLSEQEPLRDPISIDQATLLFAALMALFTFYSLVVFEPNVHGMVVLIAKIPIIYTVAVVCAVLPKQHWSLFQRRSDEQLPAFGYALSGAMAWVGAIVVSLVIDIVLGSRELGLVTAAGTAWESYWGRRYPWSLLPVTAAIATAALIDCRLLTRHFHGWRLRALEAAVMGGVMGLASSVVLQWLALVTGTSSMPAVRAVVLIVLVGAVIGALVPTWYRRNNQPQPAAIEKAPAGALQP